MPKRDRPGDSPPAKGGRKTVSLCVTCEKESDTDCVECDWCGKWQHRECAGLTSVELAALADIWNRQSSDSNVMFFCTVCKPKVTLALKFFTDIQDKQEDMNKRLSEIEDSIKKLQPTESLSQMELSDDNTSDQTQSASQPTVQISEIVNSYINEEKEKSKRRLNVIVHNIVESTSEDAEVRRKHDIDSVSCIFEKHLAASANITKAIRIGKRGDKPRLLKISVASESEKAAVMRNCTKLRNTNLPSIIQRVFITPDLTPKEQTISKKLRAELKELNKDGKKFRIKNWKIVQRGS